MSFQGKSKASQLNKKRSFTLVRKSAKFDWKKAISDTIMMIADRINSMDNGNM